MREYARISRIRDPNTDPNPSIRKSRLLLQSYRATTKAWKISCPVAVHLRCSDYIIYFDDVFCLSIYSLRSSQISAIALIAFTCSSCPLPEAYSNSFSSHVCLPPSPTPHNQVWWIPLNRQRHHSQRLTSFIAMTRRYRLPSSLLFSLPYRHRCMRFRCYGSELGTFCPS
jgi:hypothetical protein